MHFHKLDTNKVRVSFGQDFTILFNRYFLGVGELMICIVAWYMFKKHYPKHKHTWRLPNVAALYPWTFMQLKKER